MDLLPFKQNIRHHCTTEAYILTHSQYCLNIKICYFVMFSCFPFCIELWMSNLTEIEEIS
jgi:hypothetical protein